MATNKGTEKWLPCVLKACIALVGYVGVEDSFDSPSTMTYVAGKECDHK